jgi:hypothetical protein
MLDLNIREEQLNEISKTRIEGFRRAVELERQIPHTSWRHRVAHALMAWARKLEPEIKPSRKLAA